MNILVIGDVCNDIFRYGEVNRLAPEAPVPIIKPETEVCNLGMAGNVVENLRALKAKVDFITNTTEINKIRYVCSKYNHLLLRVDENDKCERIDSFLLENVNFNSYDAVVISDYCKGFLTEKDIEYIAIESNYPVFLDTKKTLGDWAYNIDFIKINTQEYEKNKHILSKDLFLQNKVIMTRGKYGCEYQGINYPTQEVSVKDVSGAGDTFLAGLVVEYLKTKDIVKAIEFAQKCTTYVVQKPGVSIINLD
jgi:D-beta-D-heptose 7-phosphate kinase/D-beta-D-heptose 1-phosphate adenosyltransferase